MDDYYDSISEGYEELHRDEQLEKLEFVKHKLEAYNLLFGPRDVLLDVGCGTGLTTRFWEFTGCNRTGVDPAKKLLAKAEDKDWGSRYILAAAEHLPFSNDSFDVVISITAIQNFRDAEKGLLEMKRVGKNLFVLTFLKRVERKDMINSLIRKNFQVIKTFEVKKDYIFFCRK